MASGDYVTLPLLRGMGYTLIAITTIIVCARLYQPLRYLRTFQWEDGWLIVAFAWFLVISIMWQVVAQKMFNLEAVAMGKMYFYEGFEEEAFQVQKAFFVCASSFWFSLWSVKASLLALYKKMMVGLKTHTMLWYTVAVICFLVLVGAVTTSMLSCSSMKAWFTKGACSTPRDTRVSHISLWYAYGVDVATDLMLMILPLGLIWKLQMPLAQKASVGGLFCLATIVIIVASIRVTELGSKDGGFDGVRPTWLAFWGQLESAISLVIGCCPGLYRTFKAYTKKKNSAYNSHSYGYRYGYGKPGSQAMAHGSRVVGTDIPLRTRASSALGITKTTEFQVSTRVCDDAASSQEELTRDSPMYPFHPGRQHSRPI